MRYKIQISEPWDFVNEDGSRYITGKVINEVDSTCLIFQSDKTVNFQSIKGRYFLLVSRYKGESLKKNGRFEGTVGGGLLKLDILVGLNRHFLESNSEIGRAHV